MNQAAPLERLEVAILKALKRTGYERTRQKEHEAFINEHEEKFFRAQREAIEILKANVRPELAKGKDPKKIAEQIIDWPKAMAKILPVLKEPLREAFYETALRKEVMAPLRKERGDPIGQAADRFASQAVGDLIRGNLWQNDLDQIRDAVRRGIDLGLDPKRVAKDIKKSWPYLTSKHSRAVWNYYDKLETSGVPKEEAERRANIYKDKLLNYRARMIARTEMSRASNEAILYSYERYGITKVKWVTDADPCPECAEKGNKVYHVLAAHGQIPAHPHCECTWVIGKGKIKPTNKEAAAWRELWESSLANDRKEVGRWYDELGEILLDVIGDEENIRLPRSTKEMLKQVSSPWSMHTHPYPTAASDTDLDSSKDFGEEILDIVTEEGVWRLVFKWPTPRPPYTDPSYIFMEKWSIYRKWRQDRMAYYIEQGMTPDEADDRSDRDTRNRIYGEMDADGIIDDFTFYPAEEWK